MKVAMKGNDKVPIRLLFAFSKQKVFQSNTTETELCLKLSEALLHVPYCQ